MARKIKPKPIDQATRARFVREKRCFEPDHDRRIEDLSGGLEDHVKMVAALEDVVSSLKADKLQMITKGEAEESAITARLEGYREGERETLERLKKEKVCHDPFHNFYSDKTIANLNINQVMRMYLYLAKMGADAKITAFIPKGYEPGSQGSSRLELDKLVDDAISAVFKRNQFLR